MCARTDPWFRGQTLPVLGHGGVSPPTHVLRFFATVVNGISVWTHVNALASEHYHATRHPWSQWNTQLQAHTHVIHSEQDTPHDLLPDHVTNRWSFTTAPRSPPLAAPTAAAKFQNTRWFLYASRATINTLNDTQRLRLHTFIRTHHQSYSDIWQPHPSRSSIYKAYTRGIRQALGAKDLGRWASLLQQRVTYLPYDTHPLIRLIRALSRTHTWHTSVSPDTMLIYVAVHTYLLVCYVGKTTLASTQRLRKHVTTSLAGTEDSSFHDLLKQTSEADWTLVPVELVDNTTLGCYREREWWHTLHAWTVNDTAPALPTAGNANPGAQHAKQLQTTLRQAHIARINKDFARSAVLNRDIQRIAARMNIPLGKPVNITVPYLTPSQRALIARVINKILRSTAFSALERKTVRTQIRVVSSSPLNVRRAFERHVNKAGRMTDRPPCFCNPTHLHTWQQGGDVRVVNGHYAMLPINIQHKSAPLRASDPLPCAGTRSRQVALQALAQLAQTVHANRAYTQQSISALLPQEAWDEDGLLRQRVCTAAHSLNSVAYVRIADKSSAMLFGFCHQWVWDSTIEFLSNEGYTHQPLTHAQRIHKALKHIVRKNGWPANPSSVLPLLYLIGKAKSLVKCSILWRPIAAVVEPQVQRFFLRMAARAFTLLLKTLISEIPGCFLVLRISDMNDWFHGLSDWNCQFIAEADCSGQFNNIKPQDVMTSLSEAVTWLQKRRRWSAADTVWSIHRDNKSLDRAGKGTSDRFFHMAHTDLENLVYFSLMTDTFTQASGRVWDRQGAIPMGGPFSAQAADLRSIWGVKQRIDLMRRLGRLHFTERGHPLWLTPTGNTLSLSQFRDNVMVAARGPTAKHTMKSVTDTLTEIWDLPVLCPCITDTVHTCTTECMTTSVTAMGITVHLHKAHPPLIYTQPSGLTNTWCLKYSVTLQSPWARDYKHVASIIVSAVLNVQPFLHSWLGVLISITAWCQISLLSGYPRSAVLRALHSAVPRIVSRTPWDVEATQAWTVHILYSLPSTRDTIFYRLRQWLQGHGLWSGAAYASWHVPHTGPCSETCADWCYDFPILSAHTPRGDPSQPIPVGPPARGEGDSAFPLLSVHT